MVSLRSLVAGVASIALITAPVMAKVEASGIQQAFSAIDTRLQNTFSIVQRLAPDAHLSLDGPGPVSELVESFASIRKAVSNANSLIAGNNERSLARRQGPTGVALSMAFCDFVDINNILTTALSSKVSIVEKVPGLAPLLSSVFEELDRSQYQSLATHAESLLRVNGPYTAGGEFGECIDRLKKDMKTLIDTYKNAALRSRVEKAQQHRA